MKIFTILISILLLIYINTQTVTVSECLQKGTSGKKTSDCENLKTTIDTNHCCYFKYKSDSGESEGCTEITKDVYDDIKKYIKDSEKEGDSINFKVKKLDCYSSYLTLSLLSLVLLLL